MRALRTVVAFFCALSLVCMVSVGCKEKGANATDQAESRSVKERTIEVKVAPVKVMDVDYTIDAVGSFLPNDDVTISSEVIGTVREVFVDEGDPVDRGDILLKIDDEKAMLMVEETMSMVMEAKVALDKLVAWTRKERIKQIEANLDQAKIDLEKIKNDYMRYKELYENGVVDKSTFDNVQARYEISKRKVLSAEEEYRISIAGPTREEVGVIKAKVARAEARLRVAEKNLKDTTVLSPITGMVSKKVISVGEYVKAGTKLIRIVQNDPLKLSLSIPERFAGEVRTGQTLLAGVKAFPKERFEGKIYYISPESDRSTRSFEVKAKIGNKDSKLRPGFFAEVALITSVKKHAMVLPEETVVLVAEKPSIFIVRKDRAVLDHIRVGRRFSGKVEVISEKLKENDTVVTAGQNNLVDGAPVKVAKER